MTQSNDLPSRINRAEDNIIDLRLAASALLQATDKNSGDIAALIEVSRRNSEGLSVLLEATRRSNEQIAALRDGTSALQVSQTQTDEAIRDIRAATERMDRLFDYLIRRDQERSE